MGIRVLSGVLRPRSGFGENGSATITLDPGSLSVSGDASGLQLAECGEGEFISNRQLCTLVAIRAFHFTDTDRDHDTFWGGSGNPGQHRERWEIDTQIVNPGGGPEALEVTWSNEGGATFREIAFQITGCTRDRDPKAIKAAG